MAKAERRDPLDDPEALLRGERPGLLLSERSYREDDPEGVGDLRAELRRENPWCCALDPGKHGAALFFRACDWKLRKPHLFLLAEDWSALFASLETIRVRVLLVEAGYVSRRMQAGGIDSIRNGGFLAGAITSRRPVHLIWVPPSTWQFAILDLPSKSKSKDRKAAALAAARASDPELLARGRTAKDREGIADVRGIVEWWLRGSMGYSPLRR